MLGRGAETSSADEMKHYSLFDGQPLSLIHGQSEASDHLRARHACALLHGCNRENRHPRRFFWKEGRPAVLRDVDDQGFGEAANPFRAVDGAYKLPARAIG